MAKKNKIQLILKQVEAPPDELEERLFKVLAILIKDDCQSSDNLSNINN